MPSLEIICIDQEEPITFSDLPFEVEAERELRSHRSPEPLFQTDFDQLRGIIYHVLEPGGITVYELLKRDWYDADGNSNGREENIEFLSEIVPAMYKLLKVLLTASPAARIVFTTDYQFGPKRAKRFGSMPLEEFWRLHHAGRIRMNSLYDLTES